MPPVSQSVPILSWPPAALASPDARLAAAIAEVRTAAVRVRRAAAAVRAAAPAGTGSRPLINLHHAAAQLDGCLSGLRGAREDAWFDWEDALATRLLPARIGMLTGGVVRVIELTHNGGQADAGRLLLTHYRTADRVAGLLALGDLRNLGPSVLQPVRVAPDGGLGGPGRGGLTPCLVDADGVPACVAYARDLGEGRPAAGDGVHPDEAAAAAASTTFPLYLFAPALPALGCLDAARLDPDAAGVWWVYPALATHATPLAAELDAANVLRTQLLNRRAY